MPSHTTSERAKKMKNKGKKKRVKNFLKTKTKRI